MMESGLSASDIALLGNEGGMGNMGFFWIFALLLLFGGGYGFGNKNNVNDYATAASQQQILFGQEFQNVNTAINKVGDGLASLGYSQLQQMDANTSAINGNITAEGRAIQSQLCAINSNIDNKFAALEKSQLEQKIAEQAQAISQLQMQAAMSGVVKYPQATTYSIGMNPYCNCGCNNI